MTDEQIAAFIERIQADEVNPREFEKLTIGDIRGINRFLKDHSEQGGQKHVDVIFTSRLILWTSNPERGRTHPASEMLAELEMSEQNAEVDTMNDEQIQVLVNCFGFGRVEPEQLVKLTDDEFKEVLDYLKRRQEVYLHRYINSFYTNRVRMTEDSLSQNHTHSESEILNELGIEE